MLKSTVCYDVLWSAGRPNERLGRLIDPTALEVAFRISTEQYARFLNAEGGLIKSPAAVPWKDWEKI